MKIFGGSIFALLLGVMALFANAARADYYYNHHAYYHHHYAPHHYYHHARYWHHDYR